MNKRKYICICGQRVVINKDGTISKHRIPRAYRNQRAPLPYCSISGKDRRQGEQRKGLDRDYNLKSSNCGEKFFELDVEVKIDNRKPNSERRVAND